MNFKAATKRMLTACHKTAASVSTEMGRSSNFVSVVTGRAGVTLGVALEIADACGYELVLRPKRTNSRRSPDDLVLGEEAEYNA